MYLFKLTVILSTLSAAFLYAVLSSPAFGLIMAQLLFVIMAVLIASAIIIVATSMLAPFVFKNILRGLFW